MYYNENIDQFNYVTKGIKPARNCDLSSYLTLDKVKKKDSSNETHITTDKSRSQMKE